MTQILIVDADAKVHELIQCTLDNQNLQFVFAKTAKDALEAVDQTPPDVAIIDVHLPDTDEVDVFRYVRECDLRTPVIVTSENDTSDTAIEAMKAGAFDYLPKPIDPDRLECMVELALHSRRMMTRRVAMNELLEPQQHDAFVGRCEAMQQVFKAIGRVAAQDVTVLVRGESGTGKELVARAIYQHSDRANRPFLAVNCAALTETLLESELFGHERGSFTGAENQRIGKFEQCNGGTIFLDEIGDMSPTLQAKILRVLQEQAFERVGGNETIRTDVRVVSATNRNLEEMCREGEFREDLYYRLNGYMIELPPLRERGEDRVLIIEHFLALLADELGKNVTGIAPDAQAALLEYAWPGNIRELESVLRRALLYCAGSVMLKPGLPEKVRHPGQHPDDSTNLAVPDQGASLSHFVNQRIEEGTSDLYAETLAEMETVLLTRLLKRTSGNQSEAARILGITRGSLRNKIRTLGISIDQVIKVEDGDSGDCGCSDSAEGSETGNDSGDSAPDDPC